MTFTNTDSMSLGIIIEGIFYGTYVVLFILYLVLWRRSHHVVNRPLTLAHILLFSLCTISVCLDIPGYYFEVVPDVVNGDIAFKLTLASTALFAIIDCLAQVILLYRCWIIWDRRWVVVAVPGFLALVTLGGGIAFTILGNSPLWSTDEEKIRRVYLSVGIMTYSVSLGVNALTTSLLVTKILLFSQEVHSSLGSNSHRSFRIITAMLIESGLLMFAFQLVFVVLFSTELPVFNFFSDSIAQIYGITPTLLNIRVVMGSTYEKTTERTRSLRFTHSQGVTTQTIGPSMSVVGVQSRVVDIDPNEVSNERAADAAA